MTRSGAYLSPDLSTATIKVFDETQAEESDQLEAGQRVSGTIRLALHAPDVRSTTERLLTKGAALVHPPALKPWGDENVRLQDPDSLQITEIHTPEHDTVA